MTEDEIAAATSDDPWRNVSVMALRVAIYRLLSSDKPMTVTVKKVPGIEPGKWVFDIDVKTDK